MLWNRVPLTQAAKRQMIFVYRVWMMFAWGIFPLTVVAVYAATFYHIADDPLFFEGVSLGGLSVAAVFLGVMVLLYFVGAFARGQIKAIEAGREPWPWSLGGGA